MARPSLDTVDSGISGWDAHVNDNFTKVVGAPVPLYRVAAVGSLPAAALYEDCYALVGSAGAALYQSDGTSWYLVFSGNQKAGRLGEWELLKDDTYTATPPSTSRITMSDTSDIVIGDPIATHNTNMGAGTYNYNLVHAISADAYIDVKATLFLPLMILMNCG